MNLFFQIFNSSFIRLIEIHVYTALMDFVTLQTGNFFFPSFFFFFLSIDLIKTVYPS